MTSHFATYMTEINNYDAPSPRHSLKKYNSKQGCYSFIKNENLDNEGKPMTSLEFSFNNQFIIELITQRNWFPPNVHNFVSNIGLLYQNNPRHYNFARMKFIENAVIIEWCKLWTTHHKKGQRFKTTIKNISKSGIELPNDEYLLDIHDLVRQKIADKKIHNKFVKENNIKLKENIIKTLNKQTSKKVDLQYDIKQLEELLKSKKEKLKACESEIDKANDMKAILIFPGVCKDIYSVFSENKSKPELIFHNPNDITIRVVEYLKELSN